jgi:hypothetical protein
VQEGTQIAHQRQLSDIKFDRVSCLNDDITRFAMQTKRTARDENHSAMTKMAEKRTVQRQTTMQELAMSTTITTTAESALTLSDIPNGSDNLCDDLVEASCHPLLVSAGDNTVSAVRLKPTQKLKCLRQKELDLGTYMARREMSPFQERMNAITILPNPIYCLYFILAGHWIKPVLQHVEYTASASSIDDLSLRCFQSPSSSSWLSFFHLYHYLPSLPPPAVLAIWFGITLHAPFSFLYHYKYAHGISDSAQRVAHWSRRMDHSGIHACSALLAYATSGSYKYFFVNVLFNADCIFRQFQSEVSHVFRI